MKKKSLVFSIFLGLAALMPGLSAAPAVADQSERLAQQLHPSAESLRQVEAIAQAFIDALVNGEYARARDNIDASITGEWPPEEIQTEWQRVLNEHGNFQEYVSIRSKQLILTSTYLVSARVVFENGAEDILVILSQDQRIIGIDLPRRGQDIGEMGEEFVDALANNDFALARYNLHPELKRDLSVADIERRWNEIQSITGRLERRFAAEVRRGSGIYDVVIVPVEFENVTDDLLITFDIKRRIVGIDFPLISED